MLFGVLGQITDESTEEITENRPIKASMRSGMSLPPRSIKLSVNDAETKIYHIQINKKNNILLHLEKVQYLENYCVFRQKHGFRYRNSFDLKIKFVFLLLTVLENLLSIY